MVKVEQNGQAERARRKRFAAELAALRHNTGMSQQDLADLAHHSIDLVKAVESCRRAPSEAFAKACDEAFDLPGTLERLRADLYGGSLPSWFAPWKDVEGRAVQLRVCEHSYVPGLLQTPDYTERVANTKPGVTAAEAADLVEARRERQAVLTREDSPLRLRVLLNEAALRAELPGKIMRDQVAHLLEMATHPNVTLQIVPASAGVHLGLNGAFELAQLDDGGTVGYLETAAQGVIVDEADTIATLREAWDAITAEALPRPASLALLQGLIEGWD